MVGENQQQIEAIANLQGERLNIPWLNAGKMY